MLPKLVTPKYDMIVPSTGESITYRPYVVKEEKILLIAMESQNEAAVEKAVTDIIKTCIETPINFKFGILFIMFSVIGAKSVIKISLSLTVLITSSSLPKYSLILEKCPLP